MRSICIKKLLPSHSTTQLSCLVNFFDWSFIVIGMIIDSNLLYHASYLKIKQTFHSIPDLWHGFCIFRLWTCVTYFSLKKIKLYSLQGRQKSMTIFEAERQQGSESEVCGWYSCTWVQHHFHSIQFTWSLRSVAVRLLGRGLEYLCLLVRMRARFVAVENWVRTN